MNKRQVALTVNDKDFNFTVTLAKHNEFINGFTATNKVQPSHNFVMQSCDEESKDALRELLKGDAGGAVAVQLADALNTAYVPTVVIEVKKPSATQTASSEAT